MEIMAGHIFLKNRSRYTRVKPASTAGSTWAWYPIISTWKSPKFHFGISAAAVVATLYAFNSWGDTSVIPRTIPRAWVVPIFLVMDQTMHTGRKWNTASPISHRKLLIPAQNTDIWVSVLVPPSNRAISPMILRNPRIRPPTMIAGIKGANISARLLMILWIRVWFCMAAFFTASLETPSMPATSAKSL